MATLRYYLDREKKEYRQLEKELKAKAVRIKDLEKHVAAESTRTYTSLGKNKDDRKPKSTAPKPAAKKPSTTVRKSANKK